MGDNSDNKVRYFVGSNSANGFFSMFDGVYSCEDGWRAYLIKGGPGSGKSTFMRQIAERFEKTCFTEYLHCSSDPDSLDGIVFPEQKICIMDATSPHVLEPKFPGVCEVIVNIGSCWDSTALRNSASDIISLSERCSSLHRIAQSYLRGCGIMKHDIDAYYSKCLNMDKLARFAKRLAHRELPKHSDKTGSEERRMLSVFSPCGLKYFSDTVNVLCKNIYCIQDDCGVTADVLLGLLKGYSVTAGYDVVCCYSPLYGDRIEHLLIPSLSLAFVTVNRRLCQPRGDCRTINVRRFMDSQGLQENKAKISFGKKLISVLEKEACERMKEAKQTHDLLERYYINAMDFEKVQQLCNSICCEIEQAMTENS